MKGNKRAVGVLVVAIALLMASASMTGFAQPDKIYISGLECAYVLTPGEVETLGSTLHITNQVHQNLFFSDDPAVFPNGVNTGWLDMKINVVTGLVTVFAVASFQPDGAAGTWEGHGTFLVDTLTGEQQGHAVLHGTGDFEGLTLVVSITTGNPAHCPPAPNLMSAGRWSGFIVPPEP